MSGIPELDSGVTPPEGFVSIVDPLEDPMFDEADFEWPESRPRARRPIAALALTVVLARPPRSVS